MLITNLDDVQSVNIARNRGLGSINAMLSQHCQQIMLRVDPLLRYQFLNQLTSFFTIHCTPPTCIIIHWFYNTMN